MDGGKQWQEVKTMKGMDSVDRCMYVKDEKTIYACTSDDTFMTKDGGEHWYQLGNWPEVVLPYDMSLSNSGVIFLGTTQSVFKIEQKK